MHCPEKFLADLDKYTVRLHDIDLLYLIIIAKLSCHAAVTAADD